MKKFALILGLAVMTIFACTKEDDPCEDVKYSNNIKSLLDTGCNVEGCHAAGGDQTDYSDWKNINAGAFTKRVLTDGDMPPAAAIEGKKVNALTDQQKADLKCWLENGAKND